MIPSDITFTSDQKEVIWDLAIKCKIDNPVHERITVRDYVYEMARNKLIDHYRLTCGDILELTDTYFNVDRSVLAPFENYVICKLTGKFKMIKRVK